MITVQADPKDLERIMKKLQAMGGNTTNALRNAINTTATASRKLLAQKAQQRYTVKNAGFNKHSKIKRATLSRLTATITAQGKRLIQPRFHTVAPKSGAKTEVLAGTGLKELVNDVGNRAFKAKVDNGIAMIFQRQGKNRYPLHGLYGPSVAKMLEKVYDGSAAEAGLKKELVRLYQKNLQAQIDKAVKE